jgi:hypothetical protein
LKNPRSPPPPPKPEQYNHKNIKFNARQTKSVLLTANAGVQAFKSLHLYKVALVLNFAKLKGSKQKF